MPVHQSVYTVALAILTVMAVVTTLFSFPLAFLTGLLATVTMCVNNCTTFLGENVVCGAVLCIITAIIQVVDAAVFNDNLLICSDRDDQVLCKVVFYQDMNAIGAFLWIMIAVITTLAVFKTPKVNVTGIPPLESKKASESTQAAIETVTDSSASRSISMHGLTKLEDNVKARECII